MATATKTKATKNAEASTEIATVETAQVEETKFLALREKSEVREALEANLGAGETIGVSDLTIVKVPSSGATNWQFEDIEGDVSTPTIEGVIVYYGPYGVLWGSDDPTEGEQPFMVTSDLRIGHRRSDDYGDLDRDKIEACRLEDGTYDWQKLPYAQFGSATKGGGKRVKDQRYMAILREGDTFPLLIRCPPGSLKNVTGFMKKLTVPYWRAVVELSLEKDKNKAGQVYSKIKVKLLDKLSRELGEQVTSIYTRSLGDAVKDAAESSFMNSGEDDLE